MTTTTRKGNNAPRTIEPRHVRFKFKNLWFCRVYNRTMPFITDSKLRADANGFMRQEALHSRSHNTVIQYFSDELKIDVSGFRDLQAPGRWLF